MIRSSRILCLALVVGAILILYWGLNSSTAQSPRTTVAPPDYPGAANPLRHVNGPVPQYRDPSIKPVAGSEPQRLTEPRDARRLPPPTQQPYYQPQTTGPRLASDTTPPSNVPGPGLMLPAAPANTGPGLLLPGAGSGNAVPLMPPSNPTATTKPEQSAPGLLAPPLAQPAPVMTRPESTERPAPPTARDITPNPLHRADLQPAVAVGTARPGDKQYDGAQSPQLLIEKQLPAEVQVGKPVSVMIRVRNAGTMNANEVVVNDLIPAGMEFIRSQPAATPNSHGELTWSIGSLRAGQETQISVELMPIAEGELGSVATVSMRSVAGARTKSVKPGLVVTASSPKQVLAGQDITIAISVSNPGSGTTTNIILAEHVPSSMQHPGGAELELDIGTLKPGESRTLDLTLKAATAGRVLNAITAHADAGLKAEAKCEFEVIAPALEVALDGPSRRFLERPATYTVTVANPGTAPAQEIDLVAYLPKGVKFLKADHEGTYDAANHRVLWSLEQLPAQQRGSVSLTAMPIEQGEHRLRVEGKALTGLKDAKEQSINVEGVAAILFEVADLADPIELRGETAYDVRIINQGSKAATNVQLIALIPAELKFLQAEGVTRYRTEAGRVIFEPIDNLPPKSETVYRIRAQGITAGDVRLKVQLTTSEIPQPITKEESTRVYADE
jgi:uncharacterized repeat protein (TIGR01451 family)